MTDLQAETDPEGPHRRATDNSFWAKLNVWFARRALIMFVLALIGMGAGFLGYTPGQSPGARLNLLNRKIDSTADTLAKQADSVSAATDARIARVEADHRQLRNYVRFLVVKSCLELTPETRRDLEVANISCKQFLANEP